jgi:hypothetical protein
VGEAFQGGTLKVERCNRGTCYVPGDGLIKAVDQCGAVELEVVMENREWVHVAATGESTLNHDEGGDEETDRHGLQVGPTGPEGVGEKLPPASQFLFHRAGDEGAKSKRVTSLAQGDTQGLSVGAEVGNGDLKIVRDPASIFGVRPRVVGVSVDVDRRNATGALKGGGEIK